MKRLTAFILVIIMIVMTSCGQGAQEGERDMNGQKEIPRIARYGSEIPGDYKWFDYRSAALAYDALLYGEQPEGAYFPLLWQDAAHDTFGFAAYVGDGRTGSNGWP